MAREFGRCRGCGAEIEWAKLKDRPHPFDVEPSGKGRYELVELATEDRTVAVYVPAGADKGRRLVQSHFSTCPNADEFRTKKEEHRGRRSDDGET